VRQAQYHRVPAGPLTGVRVLDLSRLVAGNMLTHILADFGAEVIKVERPGAGDDLRSWRVEGMSLFWKVYARNKKSLTLDLRKARGRDVFLALARNAQVVVESFVPGTLERWGLGAEALLAANPRLVIVRISGWGQAGPYRDKPGFGTLVEGMSGFAALNGFADRPPVLPPLTLADMMAGYSGASATLMALRAAEQPGGAGQVVDLTLFDPLFAAMGPTAAQHGVTGKVPRRSGSRSRTSCPRNIYRCRDGKFVSLSASMQAVVERLFRAINRPDLIDDPRFATNELRVQNDDLLDPIIAGFIAGLTREDALDHFARADVTVGPILDIADLVQHPYVAGRGVLASYPDAEAGALPMHHVAPILSETPGAVHSPAPALGEHTREVLLDAGYGEREIEELGREGVL